METLSLQTLYELSAIMESFSDKGGQTEAENYLEMHISKSLRSMIAQFRYGILPIRIKTGRYKREPLDKRICNLCLLKEIDVL